MLLRYRDQTIGVAIAFSLMPFAFGFHESHMFFALFAFFAFIVDWRAS